MSIKDFLRPYFVADERFERFNNFDSEQMDYTIQIQKPTGELVTLRNPNEAGDGTLTDKGHNIAPGSKLVAFGTGFWNWVTKVLHTVGIDIDTDDTHANGLSGGAFGAALEAVHRVPWWQVRRSSGGKGLHVFPKFSQPVSAATRAEASALAQAVLTLASREANFDFKAAKDCAGGNFWIYKSDAGAGAYEVIKEATTALDPDDLPPGWREAKHASKNKINYAPANTPLSADHLKIEKDLQALECSLIYRHDLGCYHIHTHALQKAHELHGYRGYFESDSTGSDLGQPNGYMFPLPGGAFLVKRFGNAKEHSSWYEGANRQYALLNTEVPYSKAVEQFSMNNTSKGYAFTHTNLIAMLNAIGVRLEIPEVFRGRTLFVKKVKDDARITVEKQDNDLQPEEWTGTDKAWQRSFAIPPMPKAFAYADTHNVSDLVRAVATDTESAQRPLQRARLEWSASMADFRASNSRRPPSWRRRKTRRKSGNGDDCCENESIRGNP